MDHFKSDFLKVFMLFIIFISFTSGGNQALKDCKLGMRLVFGSERFSLRFCVDTAIFHHRIKIWPSKNEPYLQDVNEYYRSMHTLISAEGIELPEDFCKRLDVPEIRNSLFMRNRNETDCKRVLKYFENAIPESIINNADPTDTAEIRVYNAIPESNINNAEPTDTAEIRVYNAIPESNINNVDPTVNDILVYSTIYKAEPTDTEEIRVYKLKKRILYNALYNHVIGDDTNSPYIHPGGSYGYTYLYVIEPKLRLIDGYNLTPKKFCENKHNNGEEDDDDHEDDGKKEDDKKKKYHKYHKYDDYDDYDVYKYAKYLQDGGYGIIIRNKN